VTIGLIGYGRFGKFAAEHLAKRAHVLVFDVKRNRGKFPSRRIRAADLQHVAAQRVVVLAVPISALQATLRAIAPLVMPGSLIIDVCSVKMHPVRWMKALLPPTVFILGTHPLFGPDSATASLRSHRVVVCPVRIARGVLSTVRQHLGAVGVVCTTMTPEAHDRFMAETLLLAQCVGRVVAQTDVRHHPYGTASYERLMNLAQTADNDTRELFHDMVKYNPYAVGVLRRLLRAQRKVLKDLPVRLLP